MNVPRSLQPPSSALLLAGLTLGLVLGGGVGESDPPTAQPFGPSPAQAQPPPGSEAGAARDGPAEETERPGPVDLSAARATLARQIERLVDGPEDRATAARGPIVDDEWNRGHFRFCDRLARSTGLPFVDLAVIRLRGGDRAVDAVVAELPDHAEAQRLRRLRDLTSPLRRAQNEEFLAALRDPSLDEAEQRARYWQAIADAWDLRVGVRDGATLVIPERARECAELTASPPERLAQIMLAGGTIGLRNAVRLVPDLPNREACLERLRSRR